MDVQDIYTIAISTHGYCTWLNIAGVINSPIYARYDSSGATATGIIEDPHRYQIHTLRHPKFFAPDRASAVSAWRKQQ
jgi:hypothetical protein